MIGEIEEKRFQIMNQMASKGGIVLVGSDFFAGTLFYELAQAFHIDEKIYNRSFQGASVSSVSEMLDLLVSDLSPRRVIFHLGDREAQEGKNVDEFISAYEWMLYSVHAKCNAEICVASLEERSELHTKYNDALKRLCGDAGCKYIDLTSAFSGIRPEVSVFNAMKLYMQQHFDFADLMLMR